MTGEAVSDPYDLDRFVTAQDAVWSAVTTELRAGRKTSHWSWFVLPQIDGLSRSAMGAQYAIASPSEARALLAHPVLGPRLDEVAGIVMSHEGRSARDILGGIDAMKLRSCMSLFEGVAETPRGAPFAALLDSKFGGERCPRTLDWLARHR
ncbi:MAG: DUF1810 domain-containing protein [Pseudomonadota bacterium]